MKDKKKTKHIAHITVDHRIPKSISLARNLEYHSIMVARIVGVRHEASEFEDLHTFVMRFFNTLDIWEWDQNYVVVNSDIHGVPCGSTLRFDLFTSGPVGMESGACDRELLSHLRSKVGQHRKAKKVWIAHYDISTALPH